jgi:2-desacetyl-2-hydroxyethyl bacteriochlorophyllide A dehydrogenase
MQAVVMKGPGDLVFVDVADPEPGPGEVVVAVALTGVCGTDLHILDGHFATARFPLIPGHEVTGTVVAVGEEVRSLREGDRVVVDPGVPCTTCLLCRRGRPNLCENRNAVGVTRNGGAAERVAVAAANCHRLPDDVSFPAAVLAEPLACVLHALDLVPAPVAQRVLVYGAGTIGLLAVQAARHLGAHRVDVVDTNPDRLAAARRVGAAEATGPERLPEGRADWDLVVDATGAVAAITDGLSRVQRGGTFLQIGVAPGDAVVPLSPYQIFAREITLVGSMTTRHTFPPALRLLERGIIDVELLVEEPVPLSDYAAAVARVRAGRSLKVVVGPDR